MKRIILSLAIISVVGAVVAGATGAFFSDTETSTGNTFTAGAIDLTVDSTQHYNNAVCVDSLWALAPGATATVPQYPVIGTACGGTWALKDLVPTSDKFFNFGDVKPGDFGEDTISLHVLNNDAWVCAAVSNLANAENGCTEPESDPSSGNDQSCANPGIGQGELQNYLTMTVWKDDGVDANGQTVGTACDNIQQQGEPTLTSGHPVSGILPVYDSTTGHGPLASGTTSCLGVSWSLPSDTGNITQTDSITGDIGFNVVQARNNASFQCAP